MKIKIASILIAILIIAMYVPVYADTTIPPLPTDGWPYWVVANGGTSSNPVLYYYTSYYPIKVWKPNHYNLMLDTYKVYRYKDNEWKLEMEGLEEISFGFVRIYAANHDIPYEEGSDDFFFLRPKVPPLYQATRTVDFGTTLRNFSTGLIPIIGFLVLLISLRKGWEFLRTQLTN